MKLYKSLFIATALLGGMMASCSEDGVWDKASQANLWLTNGTSYAFDNTTIDYTYYPVDVMKDMDVNITITRGTTEGTIEIPIEAVFSDDELISGPASVTFQDGSNVASYPIHVKQEFEPGVSAVADLKIDSTKVGIPTVEMPEKLQPGATHEDSVKFLADSTAHAVYVSKLKAYKLATTVTIQKDYNWQSLGMGTYKEGYFWGTSASVEILQAVEDAKKYRVMLDMEAIVTKGGDEVDGNQSTQTTITLLEKGQDFRGVTIDGDGYVYFTPINTGCLNDGLDMICYHPMDVFDAWSRFNNSCYVSKYQKDGTPAIINLSGAILLQGTYSGWAPCQSGTAFAQIIFPGVKVYNYGAKIEYAGLFTNPSNVTYALADYELTGSDAKNAQAYKVAVISQNDDADAVADAILAGEYPASDLDDVLKNDRIQIEIPEGLTGKLQVILVIIDKNEEGTALEVKNVVAAPFEYYAGGNPWKSLGTDGVYYDDFVLPFATGYAYGPWPVEVEVEEHSETPGLYRVKAMYAGIAAAFGKTGGENEILIHAENPNAVYFLTQPTGLDLGNGEYSIVSYGGDDIEYFTKQGYSESVIINAMPEDFGTLKDGVITLPVLPRTDSDGNPVYDSEGNQKVFQGYLYVGESGYYACTNGGFQLILPGASPAAVAKAKRAAAAASFEYRLNLNNAKQNKMNVKPNRKIRKLILNYNK